MPEIDVVIPARNRLDQLAQSLDRLTQQTYEDFGVIVVDDCSDQAVEPLLPRDLFERLALRVIRNEQWGGPAAARNTGVGASDATLIAFVDDDVIADPRLLARHHRVLREAPRAYAIRQYARFDVLIDRLDPSRAWMEYRLRELRRASPLSRGATWALTRPPIRGVAGPALLAGSRILRRAGLDPFARHCAGLASTPNTRRSSRGRYGPRASSRSSPGGNGTS